MLTLAKANKSILAVKASGLRVGLREVTGRGNGVRLCHYRSGATLSLCPG